MEIDDQHDQNIEQTTLLQPLNIEIDGKMVFTYWEAIYDECQRIPSTIQECQEHSGWLLGALFSCSSPLELTVSGIRAQWENASKQLDRIECDLYARGFLQPVTDDSRCLSLAHHLQAIRERLWCCAVFLEAHARLQSPALLTHQRVLLNGGEYKSRRNTGDFAEFIAQRAAALSLRLKGEMLFKCVDGYYSEYCQLDELIWQDNQVPNSAQIAKNIATRLKHHPLLRKLERNRGFFSYNDLWFDVTTQTFFKPIGEQDEENIVTAGLLHGPEFNEHDPHKTREFASRVLRQPDLVMACLQDLLRVEGQTLLPMVVQSGHSPHIVSQDQTLTILTAPFARDSVMVVHKPTVKQLEKLQSTNELLYILEHPPDSIATRMFISSHYCIVLCEKPLVISVPGNKQAVVINLHPLPNAYTEEHTALPTLACVQMALRLDAKNVIATLAQQQHQFLDYFFTRK